MPNRLLERLGDGAASALFDEFVWPASGDSGGEERCEVAGDTTAAVHGCSADGDTTTSAAVHNGTADGDTDTTAGRTAGGGATGGGAAGGGAAGGGAAGGYGAGGDGASRSAAQLPALRNLLVHGRLQLEEVRP